MVSIHRSAEIPIKLIICIWWTIGISAIILLLRILYYLSYIACWLLLACLCRRQTPSLASTPCHAPPRVLGPFETPTIPNIGPQAPGPVHMGGMSRAWTYSCPMSWACATNVNQQVYMLLYIIGEVIVYVHDACCLLPISCGEGHGLKPMLGLCHGHKQSRDNH